MAELPRLSLVERQAGEGSGATPAVSPHKGSVLQLTCCRVDLAAERVTRDGQEVPLTTLEARLLAFLAVRLGQDVPRGELLEQVWSYSPDVITRAVDSTVNRLRTKIEVDPKNPVHLQTVWGHGYRLVLPVARLVEAPRSGNIDPDLDTFFGRARELQLIEQELQRGARLVSLVGMGGAGKTRLAREAARGLRVSFAGGAWFAPLEGARCSADIVRVLARVFGVRVSDVDEGIGAIAASLRGSGDVLLVADNVEQCLEPAASALVQLLREAPGLQVLCTSRAALRVAAERVVDVGPLEPDDGVALLVARCRPEFQAEAGGELLHAIVERLDGLPLALEIAAGLTDILAPHDLACSLDRMLDVLTSVRVDRPERHGSLRAAVEGCVGLLDEEGRRDLAACSVFRGGMSLAAAEAVLCDDSAGALLRLRKLRDKSLLRVLPGHTHRFALYEAVRVFAEELLEARGEAEGVAGHHTCHFAAEADRRVAHGATSEHERAWLSLERDNIRAAFERALGVDPVRAAHLARGLFQVFAYMGPISDAVSVLGAALDAGGQLPPSVLGNLHLDRGVCHWFAGRAGMALSEAQEAQSLARLAGDIKLEGRAGSLVAAEAVWRGDNAHAIVLFEQALALQRQARDAVTIARTLGNMGTTLWGLGHADRARACFEESHRLHLAQGAWAEAAMQHAHCGAIDGGLGRVEAGRSAMTEALAQLETSQRAYPLIHVLVLQAELELSVDRCEVALGILDRAEGLAEDHGSSGLLDGIRALRAGCLWRLGRSLEAHGVLGRTSSSPGRFPSARDLVQLALAVDDGQAEELERGWRALSEQDNPWVEARRVQGIALLDQLRDPEAARRMVNRLSERHQTGWLRGVPVPELVIAVLRERLGLSPAAPQSPST